MNFCGIVATESIQLHPEGDLNELYAIDLVTSKHEPKFLVYSPSVDGWAFEFWYTSRTDYERVKMCIMDVACECEDLIEMLELLSEIFIECFGDMLVDEDEYECAGQCAGCSNHLN